MADLRTTRIIALVVDTHGLSQKEHDLRVQWAEANLQNSLKRLTNAGVTILVADKNGKILGETTFGGPPEEERLQIATQLIKGTQGERYTEKATDGHPGGAPVH